MLNINRIAWYRNFSCKYTAKEEKELNARCQKLYAYTIKQTLLKLKSRCPKENLSYALYTKSYMVLLQSTLLSPMSLFVECVVWCWTCSLNPILPTCLNVLILPFVINCLYQLFWWTRQTNFVLYLNSKVSVQSPLHYQISLSINRDLLKYCRIKYIRRLTYIMRLRTQFEEVISELRRWTECWKGALPNEVASRLH